MKSNTDFAVFMAAAFMIVTSIICINYIISMMAVIGIFKTIVFAIASIITYKFIESFVDFIKIYVEHIKEKEDEK